jgi:hypothetical protein
MDDLLAGTLFSLIDGVSMPGYCPALLHLLLLVCGKHSAPSRTPFRSTVDEQNCSPSHRNGVRWLFASDSAGYNEA